MSRGRGRKREGVHEKKKSRKKMASKSQILANAKKLREIRSGEQYKKSA